MNLDNLSDFIGQPVIKVNKLFRDNGWVFYNSFNDYKFVWINKSIKESVVLCTDFDFSSDDMNECEVVVDVVHFDGIYHENEPVLSIEEILLTEPQLEWVVNYCIRQNELAKEGEIYFYEVWSFVKTKIHNLIGYYAKSKTLANSRAWDTFHNYLLDITPNTL